MSVAGSARFTTSTKTPAPARVKGPTLTGGTMGGVYWVREKKESDELKIDRRNPKPSKQKNWVTGDVYKGSWNGDKRHGFGIQIWANGNKYEGMWKNNLRDGHGVLWIRDDPAAAAASAANKASKAAGQGTSVHINASLTSTHQQNLQSQRDKQKRALHMMALTSATGGSTLSAATHAAAAAAQSSQQAAAIAAAAAGTSGAKATAAAQAAAGGAGPGHVSQIPDGNGPIFDPLTKLRKLYAGNWREGLKHGKGVYFYANGAAYEGDWRNGVRQGKGTLYLSGSASGDVYVGEWSGDKQNGFGTLTRGNGDIYEGNWLNGKREGEGMFYYKTKEQIFEGEWVADIPKCGVFMSAADFFVGRDAKQQKAAADASAAAAAAAGKPLPADSKTDSKYGPPPSAAAAAAASASSSSSSSAATATSADADALEVQKKLGSLRMSDALAPVYKLPDPDPALRAAQQPKSVVLVNVGGNTDDLFDTPRFIRKDPKKPLPELRLANSDLLLAERIESIQNERAAVRAMAHIPLDELFDAETLDELRRAYSSADESTSGSGSVAVTSVRALLEAVGEAVTEPEFASICVDLDKTAASSVQFHEFVKAVHLARHARALDRQLQANANASTQAGSGTGAGGDSPAKSDDAGGPDGDGDGDGDDGDVIGDEYDAAEVRSTADAASATDGGGDGGYHVPQSPGGQSNLSNSSAQPYKPSRAPNATASKSSATEF